MEPEVRKLVEALMSRTDLAEAGHEALRGAFPDAPPAMLQTAVFHVFTDGVGAALAWLAAVERFLREPGGGLDYGATWHLLYHLYNWQQFQALLPSGQEGVLELLGDAILVVPCPLAESSAYGHLAAFTRHAPQPQRHALWQAVGEAMARRVGAKPVWLSTAGAGVSWLHVRLDDRPKYYGFGPYR